MFPPPFALTTKSSWSNLSPMQFTCGGSRLFTVQREGGRKRKPEQEGDKQTDGQTQWGSEKQRFCEKPVQSLSSALWLSLNATHPQVNWMLHHSFFLQEGKLKDFRNSSEHYIYQKPYIISRDVMVSHLKKQYWWNWHSYKDFEAQLSL